MDGLSANYRYWREEGRSWVEEYSRRKKWILRYHLQELYIVEYVGQRAPARVLEFGCGVGRHLKNLVKLPNVEVYGCDQSPTMLEGIATVAPAMALDRVTLIEPLRRLPYPDDEFDLVFTCEVLEHVAPEDLSSVLCELSRISRGEILHLEPPPEISLHSTDHGGCWSHDLSAVYASLGLQAEVLPSPISEQKPIRVRKASRRTESPLSATGLALLRDTEHALELVLRRAEANGLIEGEGPAAELAVLKKRLGAIANVLQIPLDVPSTECDVQVLSAIKQQYDQLAMVNKKLAKTLKWNAKLQHKLSMRSGWRGIWFLFKELIARYMTRV